MNLAWVGILLAVIGNTILAVGFVLQKLVHVAQAEQRDATKGNTMGENSSIEDGNMESVVESTTTELTSTADAKSHTTANEETSDTDPSSSQGVLQRVKDDVYYLGSWKWWVGLVAIILGEVMNSLAFAFASGSVIPPIGAVALALIAILSFFVLGERPSVINWIGLAVSMVGVALVGRFAPTSVYSESSLSAAETAFLSRRPQYFIFAAVWAVVFFVVIALVMFRPTIGRKVVLVYALLAGIAGMFKTRAIKSSLQMITDTFSSERNNLRSIVFWGHAALALVAALLSVYFLNKGQAYFRQTLIVPVYFCIFATLSVLSANLFYKEFLEDDFNIPAYVSGLVALGLGVILFSLPRTSRPDRAQDAA